MIVVMGHQQAPQNLSAKPKTFGNLTIDSLSCSCDIRTNRHILIQHSLLKKRLFDVSWANDTISLAIFISYFMIMVKQR